MDSELVSSKEVHNHIPILVLNLTCRTENARRVVLKPYPGKNRRHGPKTDEGEEEDSDLVS